MKKKNLIYSVLILLLIFNSCISKNSETKKKDLFFIECKNTTDIIKIDSLCGEIKFINVCPKEIIGHYSKLIEYKGRYFISDNSQTKSIYCFDNVGETIFKICSLGRGPGEYTRLYDFSIDTKNDMLVVYVGTKLLFFSLVDGHFIKEKNFKILAEEIAIQSNGNILFYSSDNKNKYNQKEYQPGLLSYNTETDILNQVYSITDKEDLPRIPRTLNGYGKEIIFSPISCDTVYSIDNDMVNPLFHYSLKRNQDENIMFSSRSNETVYFVYTKLVNKEMLGFICIGNLKNKTSYSGMGISNNINGIFLTNNFYPSAEGFVTEIENSTIARLLEYWSVAIKDAQKENDVKTLQQLKELQKVAVQIIDSVHFKPEDNNVIATLKFNGNE